MEGEVWGGEEWPTGRGLGDMDDRRDAEVVKSNSLGSFCIWEHQREKG